MSDQTSLPELIAWCKTKKSTRHKAIVAFLESYESLMNEVMQGAFALTAKRQKIRETRRMARRR